MAVDYMRQAQEALARGDSQTAQRILSTPVRPPARGIAPLEDPPDWYTFNAQQVFGVNGKMSGEQFKRVNTQLRAEYKKARQFGIPLDDLPKPEEMHQPWIWWALDKLRIPQYMTNSLVYSLAGGVWDPVLLMKGIAAAATGDLKVEGRDVVSKVFSESAFPEDSWQRTFAGFAWDVIADPLNFVSIGILTKGGKLAQGIRMAGGIARAGEEFKDITGMIQKAERAMPYLREVGPEIARKMEQAAGRKGFFSRMLSEMPSFTDDELAVVQKLGAQIDPVSGMVQPGARMWAADSKYGRIIQESFQNGKLEDLVLGNTFLEKLERGQAGFFNVFGHSIMPKGWDAAIYKAGAGLFQAGAENMQRLPGMKTFFTATSRAAAKGKSLFSTSMKQFVKNPETGEAMDSLLWGGQSLKTYFGQRYTRAGVQMSRQLGKLGVSAQDKISLIKAIELPMLDQVRDHLLLDQGARKKLVDVLSKQAEVAPHLFSKVTIPSEFLGETVTPETINQVMGQFRAMAQSGVDGAANWKMVWDEAFAPWTKYGGEIFGKWGTVEDIALKRAKLLEPFSPQVKQVVAEFEDTMKRLGGEEQAAGVGFGWLKGYFPHRSDGVAFDVQNQMPFIMGRKIGKVGQDFTKERSEFLFLEDVVKKLEETGGGGEVMAEAMVKDPALALVIRGAKEHAEAVSGAWVHRQLAEQFGKGFTDEAWNMLAANRPKMAATLMKWRQDGVTLEKAVEFMGYKGDVNAATDASMLARGLRRVQGDADLRMKGFLKDDYYFPEDVARAIEGTIELHTSKLSQNVLVKTMNTITNWWKGWSLGVRPAFHVRNYATNLIQEHLAGLRGASMLEAHTLAGAFQAKITREWYGRGKWAADELTGAFWERKLVDVNGKPHATRAMADYMQRFVNGRGVFGIDNPEAVGDALKGGTLNPFSRRNHATRAGYAVGTMAENNSRMALWLHKVLNEGMDYENAAKEVAKYLFDYDDLTSFERSIKAFVPFYTWSRKNIPMQFMNLVQHPASADVWDKVRSAAEGGEEVDYNMVSNQIANSLPVRYDVDEASGEARYFMLRNWIPIADLEELHEPAEWAVTMLGPIPKLMIENTLNYNAYFGEKIEKYPGQRRALWGLELPAKVQHTLRTIGAVNWMNELNPGNVFGAVHEGIYGEGLPLKANEPTNTQTWITGMTGVRSKIEDPKKVLLGREYEHLETMRLINREHKTQVKRRKEKDAQVEPK